MNLSHKESASGCLVMVRGGSLPWVWLGVILSVGLSFGVVALAREGDRIIEVDVQGTKAIARESVIARVQTKPGSPYSDAIVSEDIRRLFGLGYFTDVRADVEEVPDGLRLIFVVKEKPSVATVQLEGNRALRKDRVMELFGVSVGVLHDARKVKEGVDRIKAEYARKGFSQAEAFSRVEVNDAENTAAIYLLIDEGSKMRLAEVLIEGNQAFSDRRIRKLLKTKRRWFFASVYNEDVLEEDVERILAFYRKHGYQDVAVSKKVYGDPKGKGVHVHFSIKERLQHRVGNVLLDGIALFPEPEILGLLSLKPTSIYNTDALKEDMRKIKEHYGDRGYINADVSADPRLDEATKRVNVTYHVVENEMAYVQHIIVRGNLRTKDVVVRRELRVNPGDPFDGTSIRKSIRRLYNLGFFEEVNVETESTGEPNKENLIIEVKEAKTGSFSFGGGFSSVDRLVGLVELEQRNFDWRNFPSFTGAGQNLGLKAEIGSVRRFFELAFTEPWIFGHPLSFGFDVYSRTRLRSRDVGLGFEEDRRGGGVRFGKEFRDEIQVGLGYQFYSTDITDVVDEASSDLKAEEGESNTSVVNLSAAFDRRDNRFEPTRGFYAFAGADLAGGLIQGDEDFYRLQAGASHYWPHAGRFVFESRFRAGIMDSYDDASGVPIFERFFGGGARTIRGFRERKIGPQDPNSNDPIGGEAMFVGTLEEVLTIVKDERGRPILKGSVFYDVGDVWGKIGEFGESFKSGAGVGFRVNTPIGPVKLDVGYPVSDIEGEKRKARFHFNVSRGF